MLCCKAFCVLLLLPQAAKTLPRQQLNTFLPFGVTDDFPVCGCLATLAVLLKGIHARSYSTFPGSLNLNADLAPPPATQASVAFHLESLGHVSSTLQLKI